MLACLRVLVVGVLSALITVVPAAAQQRGSISGRALDAGGLVLPGATVTVTEQNTGFTRDVVTAENGAYLVTNLDPGLYTVAVELSGFAGTKRTDLTLTAGAAITLDVTLQLAGLQEQVVVTAEVPLVQTSSNQIGGALSSNEIEDIPANFRNINALTQLVPGITPNPAASTFRSEERRVGKECRSRWAG